MAEMHILSTPAQASEWLRTQVHGALHTDSRQVRAGDGFIAWPGAASDGRQFVQSALDAGATACLVEAQDVARFGFEDLHIATYAALKAATGAIAAHYYAEPSRLLDVLAVTGTNGKTSTAWWLAQALNSLQYRREAASLSKSELVVLYFCGLVGTLGTGTPGHMVFNGLTTPDPVLLQARFAQMHKDGASACAIEASSIGLAEHRLAGTAIRTAIFTNLTQDHLDYHGNMQAYWEAKRTLFDWPDLQSAVVNLDDARGPELVDYCAARGVQVWTFSLLRTDATLWAQDMHYTNAGMQFTVCEAKQQVLVDCAMVGEYNVSNVLGVVAALRSLDIPLEAACQAVAGCTPVPGRMECITQSHAPLVVVDYAHTPDALDKVLRALRPMAQARGGNLWCVMGCGGDRDTTKRTLMAATAERAADKLVMTSDNPRSEPPDTILAQMVTGLANPNRVQLQSDRALAIADAVQQAHSHDVVLIAGKGHEDYQDIAGIKHPFSDAAHARAALQRRAEETTA
jgi:UDP-N-acetylmuramyl-tripeptide synthetase